jgi:hypothetical protein
VHGRARQHSAEHEPVHGWGNSHAGSALCGTSQAARRGRMRSPFGS